MRSSIYRDLKQMAAECGIKTKGDAVRYGIALFVLVSLIIAGCTRLNQWSGFGDENAVEELIEEHIEDTLGVSVDLSPKSRECNPE
jgi:predicted small secreted protein